MRLENAIIYIALVVGSMVLYHIIYFTEKSNFIARTYLTSYDKVLSSCEAKQNQNTLNASLLADCNYFSVEIENSIPQIKANIRSTKITKSHEPSVQYRTVQN